MNFWAISDIGFLILAAVCGTVFMTVYTYRTPWWQEEHRAHLGFFTLALTLLLWLYVARALVPTSTFMIMRRVGFDTIALMMVWRMVLLFRSKGADAARRGREDRFSAGKRT